MVAGCIRVRVDRDLRGVSDCRVGGLPELLFPQDRRSSLCTLQVVRLSGICNRQVLHHLREGRLHERVATEIAHLLVLLVRRQLHPRVAVQGKLHSCSRCHPLEHVPARGGLVLRHRRVRYRHRRSTEDTTGCCPEQVFSAGTRVLHVAAQNLFVAFFQALCSGVEHDRRTAIRHRQLLCSSEEVVRARRAALNGLPAHRQPRSVEALEQLGRGQDAEVHSGRHHSSCIVEVVRPTTVHHLAVSLSAGHEPLCHPGVRRPLDDLGDDVVHATSQAGLRRGLRHPSLQTSLQSSGHTSLRHVKTDETERGELLPHGHLGHLPGLLVVRLPVHEVLEVTDDHARDTELVHRALAHGLAEGSQGLARLGAALEQRARTTASKHGGEVKTATDDLASLQPVRPATTLCRVLEGGDVVTDVATLSETDTTDGQVAERADVSADGTSHGSSVADTTPDTVAVVLVHLDSSTGIAVTDVVEVECRTDTTGDTTDDRTKTSTDDVTDTRCDRTERGPDTSTSTSATGDTSADDTDVGTAAHPLELLVLALLLLEGLVVLSDRLRVLDSLVLNLLGEVILVTLGFLVQPTGVLAEQERGHDRVSVGLTVLREDVAALSVLTLDPDVTGLELALDTVNILDSARVRSDTRVVSAGHRVDTRLGCVLLLLVHGLQEAVVTQRVQRGPGLATSLPGRAVVPRQSQPGRLGLRLALQRLVETRRSPAIDALGQALPALLLDLVGARTLSGKRARLVCHSPSIPRRAPAPLLPSPCNNPSSISRETPIPHLISTSFDET